jgi:DNA invertase Pin-like site-specific DNA recombinase
VVHFSTGLDNKGETAMGQVHGLRELAARLDLRVRYIVVALRTSGVPDMDDRPDFGFLRDRIARGGIAWVGFRHPDRVARHTYPAEAFYRYLEQAGIELYLTSFGRKVDWVADRLTLLMHSVVAEQDRNHTVHRLTDGRIRLWLEEGRGDPASRPFGFRRDDQKFLEVDPETWPIVEAIHHGYAPSTQAGRGGLRRLVDHALEMGSNLKSPERIRKILRDPIYVTGEWGASFKGTWYRGRTVELFRPIPRDVFERNQDILAAHHGPNTRHPVGTFLLNRISLVHAPCETATVNGRPVLLRGRMHHDHSAYYHEPRCPDGCRGWSVPSADLERAVVEQLLNLARSPHLQKEWAERARPIAGAAAEDPAPQLGALRSRIDQLGRQRAEVKRRWIDDLASGNIRLDFLAEALEAIDDERSSLTKRVAFLERLLAETRKRPTPQDGLLEAMTELFRPDAERDPDLLRRRAAFVSAVVSRVVVHDREDGFAVELEGPLVPPTAPVEPVNPATGMDVSARHELSTNNQGAATGRDSCATPMPFRSVWRDAPFSRSATPAISSATHTSAAARYCCKPSAPAGDASEATSARMQSDTPPRGSSTSTSGQSTPNPDCWPTAHNKLASGH